VAPPQVSSVAMARGRGCDGKPLSGLHPRAEPHVIALTITRGRIVDLEEKLEKPTIADLGGIEDNLDGFGVGSMIAVGRVRNVTA
jgi:hypothetical protein